MSYGVVVFDDKRPDDGWASIDGESAFRIRNAGDLRQDILWWTSLSFEDFMMTGLNRNPCMRNSDFLRTPMHSLVDELGLNRSSVSLGAVEKKSPVTKVVESLSEIFSRVMTMADITYGLRESVMDKLSDDLRRLLIPEDRSISEEVDQACEMAYQTYSQCIMNPARRTRSINFRRPRCFHAYDVLSTPVPVTGWEYVQRKKLPPPSERMKWVMDSDRPVLAEANVTEVSHDIANIIAFGGGSRHRRKWISHPELLVLSRYAKVEIGSMFLFDDYEPAPVRMPPPATDGLSSMSISIGLLSENYWVGVASPQYRHGGSKIYSPRATWLRAADRAHLLSSAIMLSAAGIQVRGYGIGSITVDVPYGNLHEVAAVAHESGLLPPMTVPQDMIIQEDLS